MSSTGPECIGDAARPVHIRPRQPRPPLDAQAAAQRLALAAELDQGLPCHADRETLLAALREVWLVAQDWRAGVNDVGPAAYAEIRDAVRGDRR